MNTAEETWRARASQLAEFLRADGALTDPAWHSAFVQTPRHVFVPAPDRGDSRAESNWFDDVYSDQALLTQSAPAPDSDDGQELPTSSSSRPAIMAVMLELAGIQPADRVLEIGTGTGYNAALLCHRLGDSNVFSVDIHPGLVELARARLGELGLHPTLAVADGAQGLVAHTPYDRIIATCAVTHIPPSWIHQLADRGRIVAPFAGNVGWLLVLDKTAPDEVTGHFDPHPARFMPLRASAGNPLGTDENTVFTGIGMAHHGTTMLDPFLIHDAHPALRLFCQLHIPGLRFAGLPTNDGHGTLVVHNHQAMAEVTFTASNQRTWPVVQRGPCRLWDTIEHAVHQWHSLGQPDHTRLGITAADSATHQYVWLDDPNGTHCWPLNPTPA